MTDKPAALAFQPAPRPTPRVSADMAAQLAGANADLGFTRASSAPTADAAPAAAPAAPAFQPAPRPAVKAATPAVASPPPRRAASRPMRQTKPSTQESGPATLKLSIPETLWKSLRIEAINRRVTIKYLVLEALAKQGHLDLEEFHEDGRRLR